MSKLFNTLEQIRRNESYQVTGSNARSLSKNDTSNRRQKILIILTLTLTCIAGFYYIAPLVIKPEKDLASQQPAGKTHTPDLSQQISSNNDSVVLSTPEKPSEQNNLAAELIEKGDHWRAIYLLESIMLKNPQLVEPYINLGVALTELGLIEPAKRYLKEAMRLDPENQALLDNLTILRNAGVIDISFAPKIDREKREAGRSWFNSNISENDLMNRSVN